MLGESEARRRERRDFRSNPETDMKPAESARPKTLPMRRPEIRLEERYKPLGHRAILAAVQQKATQPAGRKQQR